ncbi:tRNA1(Val) (adenine(37)-N6)-methyltransferase [Lutibacter sp.]
MPCQQFQFKQFTICQDKTAMKVGTDGVLLGAWAEIPKHTDSILDIGSGTGLIALMMAQRSNALTIDAVEIEALAYEQTVANFECSDWGDRLFCYHASLQEFAAEIEDTYDFIISNPPFYTSTYKALPKNRAMARHTESLSYSDLLEGTVKLLAKTGSCAFVIPSSEASHFIEIANSKGLFLNRKTAVKGTETSPVKRNLLQFSFQETSTVCTTLVIETARHVYTSAYKNLVKDFYLKM